MGGLSHLAHWWQHSWCILWGPPGTGKTWTTGQQVAEALADPGERILVISTTNEATDAASLALGHAAKQRHPDYLTDETLLRIGQWSILANVRCTKAGSATKSVLLKLFLNSELQKANGLFITPFKGQAQTIGVLLAEWGLRSWEASTVHSQQGSEADIVIFDTVNAGSHTWDVIEWKRLINVALSRAREAVIVLASRSEMDEPNLRTLKKHLKPIFLVKEGAKYVWSEASPFSSHSNFQLAEAKAPYASAEPRRPGEIALCRIGDQFAARKSMKPILSQEQQRLTNLSLDGKPRLVRGVAGSGKSVVLCHWLAKTVKKLRHTGNARVWAVYSNRSLHKLLCDSIESARDSLLEVDFFERSDFPWEMVELLQKLSLQRNRAFQRKSNTLIATTPHSYKGYESEAIIIPCVDTFVAQDGQILAHALYVAMTRARSLLAIYGTHGGPEASTTIIEAVKRCLETQRSRPNIDLQDESNPPTN